MGLLGKRGDPPPPLPAEERPYTVNNAHSNTASSTNLLPNFCLIFQSTEGVRSDKSRGVAPFLGPAPAHKTDAQPLDRSLSYEIEGMGPTCQHEKENTLDERIHVTS